MQPVIPTSIPEEPETNTETSNSPQTARAHALARRVASHQLSFAEQARRAPHHIPNLNSTNGGGSGMDSGNSSPARSRTNSASESAHLPIERTDSLASLFSSATTVPANAPRSVSLYKLCLARNSISPSTVSSMCDSERQLHPCGHRPKNSKYATNPLRHNICIGASLLAKFVVRPSPRDHKADKQHFVWLLSIRQPLYFSIPLIDHRGYTRTISHRP